MSVISELMSIEYGGMILAGKTGKLEEFVPLPLCPKEISHGLT